MRILVINGPNLNMLGRREPGIYKSATLDVIETQLRSLAKSMDAEIEMFQSNHEGELVTRIQSADTEGFSGIVINPGAYGHTSIALRDAMKVVALPFVEIHVSNIYAREEFRHKTYLSDIAAGVVVGFGSSGYQLALRGLIDSINAAESEKQRH